MKRKVGLLIILSMVFTPSFGVDATMVGINWSWDTGTKIDIMAEIDSTTLESGQHSIAITVRLIDLNDDANDIHDIEVQYRIPGYYSSSIVSFDPIATTGNFQTLNRYFNYQKEWGINYLEFKIECMEDIPLLPDNNLFSDWTDFFLLNPAADPTTPTTPTNGETTPPNGFDISKDWWVFLVGGIGLLGIGAFISMFILRKRGSI